MTYCRNWNCPFKDCERHTANLPVKELFEVYLADFDATCHRYISWLVEEVQNERTM